MPFRLCPPLAANPRMENLFERAFLGGVLKDYGAKPFSIQAAIARKNLGPEFSREFLFYLRVKIDKFPCGLIGVKKFRGRNKLAQTIAEGRLARGNSARDSNGRHVIFYITEPKGVAVIERN